MMDRTRGGGGARPDRPAWETFAFVPAPRGNRPATGAGSEDRFATGGLARWLADGTFWWIAGLMCFGALTYGAVQPWAQAAQQAGAALLGAGVVLRLVRCGRGLAPITALEVSMLLFGAYAFWRYAVAPSEYVGRQDMLSLCVVLVVVQGVTRHLPTARHATGLAVVLILVASGHAFLAVWQGMTKSSALLFGMFRDTQYGTRVSGNYVCPNHFAGVLELALPLALAFALFSPWKPAVRWTLGAVCAVMGIGLALSVSRGGWISMGAGLLVFALLAGTVSRHGRRLAWGVVTLCALGAGAAWWFSDLAQSRFAAMQSPETEARVMLFRDALKLIAREPWLGTGPATFVYSHHLVQAPSYQTIARYTHSDYLNLLCDYGLVGGALGALFLGLLVLSLWRLRKRQATLEEACVWLGACSGVGAWLVHSAVDFNLHIPANAVAFAVCFSLPLAQRRRMPLTLPLARGTAWILGTVFLAVTLYLGAGAARGLAGGIYLMAGDRLGEHGDPAASERFLRAALRWDPNLAPAAERLGDLYRVRAAEAADPMDRVRWGDEALAHYEEAQRANPHATSTLRKLALAYEVLRRFPEAYLVYQEALKLDPHNPVTARMLGDHYAKRGFLDLARTEYDRALSLRFDPDTAAARAAVQRALEQRRPGAGAP